MTSTYHACEPVGSVHGLCTSTPDMCCCGCQASLLQKYFVKRLERLHGLAEEAAGESRSTVAILRACR